MPKAIQHSFVFITLIILVSVAFGDAFDQTVTQLKTLKVELEQTQASIVEKRELVETQITDFRENHPLNAPKDMFESDADYAERLQRLESTISQRLSELEHQHLSELLSRRLRIQTQLVRLHRTVFLTNNVTVTLGEYDANNEFFPITFQVGDQSIENHLDIIKDDARILYENWEEVSVTGWIVVDPGYRRGLAKVELKYPSLWEDGIAWTIDTVYELGDNNSIAFSPDGEYLATGSNTEYGVATIWKVENGEKFREMDHGDWVYAVAFSPDGEYFATAGQDETRYSSAGKAVLWEMDGGTKVRKKQLDSYAYVVTFDPNSDYWAVARQPYSSGGKALVWRVDSGDHVWSMIYNAYRSTIHALTFSPNGAYLATGNVREYRSDLDKATLWRVDTGSADLNFRHKNGVYAVAFSPNGAYLATGNEGSVTLWEISSGRSVRQIELPDTIAYAVAFSPDGEYLAVGKTNGYINFFRIGAEDITLETEILKAKSIHAGSQVSDLAWHPDGSLISDGKRVYRTLLQPIFTELVAQPVSTRKDVNGDGVVNVDDSGTRCRQLWKVCCDTCKSKSGCQSRRCCKSCRYHRGCALASGCGSCAFRRFANDINTQCRKPSAMD